MHSRIPAALMLLVLTLACAQETSQIPAPATQPPASSSVPPATDSDSAEPTIVETGPETPQPPSGDTASSTAAPSKNVTIDDVQVANPLVVSGRARTFENNVSLRVRDARGALITETFTTATGEMGQHSPYRGSIWLTRDPGKTVTVEALEYSAKDGSEQSLVSVQRPFAMELVESTLYFADQNCTAVRPFKRRIPKTISAARVLVEALIAGPLASERSAGAEASFPQGSAVRSINLRDGTMTIDFNERLQNVGGACRATMIRESVTKTLGFLPSVKKVVIQAGGSEKLALQP